MILLDTDVVSEPMRPTPNAAVLDWLDRQAPETLYLSAISHAELLVGISGLPSGRRKRGLAAALSELLRSLFEDRILPFDSAAAERFAALIPAAEPRGSVLSFADAGIAAIALQRGFTLATRDTAPFRAVGLPVIDPWME